ncbi:DUF6226 family protein [Paeniglutamicibacter cryotolerans]|uniref:Uncharacterized protein n=1 Tax=Paeniglutamicibacter cryotolerans TaxID=670079 RepID=A0A839QLJ1_9MICC|nr:DUF6226 family protein [Paeniglutamicibacter cryotolerans]MBB2994052.1 hypothetical protein [Paeniglutamicibacter cryotolerans]
MDIDMDEDLFDGPAMPAPGPLPSESKLVSEAIQASVAQVSMGQLRHVSGYRPFVGYCARQGVSAVELARNIDLLIGFLRAHGVELAANPELRDAAAVFAANSLVLLRPDARWLGISGGSPLAGNDDTQFETLHLVDGLAGLPQDSLDGLLKHLHAWADEPVDDSPELEPPALAARDEPRFTRPVLPVASYVDTRGEPIDYGNRWTQREVPESAYEDRSHLERFVGLHAVAAALIRHLEASYDVRAIELTPTGAPGEGPERILRAVLLEPAGGQGAPLEFVVTDPPAAKVRAGVLNTFVFPSCDCDACDETASTAADGLEGIVLSVVAGGYRERYPSGPKRLSEYALTGLDGSGSSFGRGEPETTEPEVLRAAEDRLRLIPEGWQAWPLRSR